MHSSLLFPGRRPNHIGRQVTASLVALLLGLLISPPLHAQPAEESGYERTGTTIDREEQIYFGLFPGIADFESAQLEDQSDGSLRIRIDRSGAAEDTVVMLDRSAAVQLRRYLYGIESVFAGDITVDWIQLDRIVRPSAPFESHRPVAVKAYDGRVYSGQILYAGDSVLILWPVDRRYRWRELDTASYVIPAPRIERIARDDEFYYGIGAGIIAGGFASYVIQSSSESAQPAVTGLALILPAAVGGYVGSRLGIDEDIDGDLERFRQEHDRLTASAMFYGVPPPEVRRLLDRHRIVPAEFTPPPPISARPIEPEPTPTHFHLGASLGSARTSVAAPYHLFTSSRPEELEPILPKSLLHIEAAYSLLERIQLGVAYERLKGEDPANDEDDREYMDLAFMQIFADFLILVPTSRLVPNVEAAVGIAAIRSESDVRGHLTSPFINSTRDTSYAVSGEGFGVGTRLRLAYHPIRYVSIELALEQSQYTSATVPQSQVNTTIGAVRKIEEHRSDISTFNVRGGIRLHF